ncbi:MAG: DUF2085 domain-containing protein [Chloroflexota bacterium]|nr:MAG: DUF2085 domain-containing protein [Chloroflexota bacterium]
MDNSLATYSVHPSRLEMFLSRYWLRIFLIGFGLYVWLPFLAPVLMKFGWEGPARAIYFVYSILCHQLPQRSFFLFGPQGMYSLAEVQAAWQDTSNPLILRQFIGNADLGWKVAWSDRMVSLFGGIWLAGLLWQPVFRKLKRLPWWGFALFMVPIYLDGASHTVSDFAGIGRGFRDTNLWLSTLTGGIFSPGFYAGDAFGSFNSWMRLVTGLLFAIGLVWFAFPYLEQASSDHQKSFMGKGSL